VKVLNWVSSSIEYLLWTNDIDVFSVSHSLANEWDILQTEDGKALLLDLIT